MYYRHPAAYAGIWFFEKESNRIKEPDSCLRRNDYRVG